MGRLDDKVAIVTGGAQGQGEAISRAFVAAGAQVVIGDIAVEAGEALAAELGDAALFVRHDVSDPDSWQQIVATAEDKFGAISVLVNNAGILKFANIADMSLQEYMSVVQVNQAGTFLGMQSVIASMKSAGGGSIVNASSIEGMGGMPSLAAYCSTKWAIRGMTKSAALELGADNIRVNSVHPGMVDTGMTRAYGDDSIMEYGATKVALKRVGLPDDLAPVYVFLASDESRYMTGAELAVDGGATATHAFGG